MKLLIPVEELKNLGGRAPIKCACEHCNVEFYNPKNIVLRALKGSNKGKYCSAACRNAHKKSTKLQVACRYCEEVFEAANERRFCSMICANRFAGKKRQEENDKRLKDGQDIPEKRGRRSALSPCKECGTLSRRCFCSMDCYRKNLRLRTSRAWINGEITGSVVSGLSQSIKKWLINEAGQKCQKCGWAEINPATKRCPLEVNHIDGNSENNIKENLEVVCPNCHSLTSNFRALNKTSKRKYRNKYYKPAQWRNRRTRQA